ncbi:MAG: small subunit ribosomal protein ispH, lytB [Thermosediminibacterales bacterium]|nr:small subunit ribosomal protein ispH, lytB [Thermosediminibacterales bacterium]
MNVFLAEYAGFCYGVERAIKSINALIEKKIKVYTLGPIIHNPQEIEKLKKSGVEVINDINEFDKVERNEIVAIRTHGVGPEVFEKAKQKGVIIKDLTCPYVKRVQKEARKLLDSGYQPVIVGDAGHPEVVSINKWCCNKAIIINSEQEVDELPYYDKIGIVAQTTLSEKKWNIITDKLKQKTDKSKVINTICDATSKRQRAAKKLAEMVDLMIVIGGRNSSNTKKLFQICRETSTKTLHIETAEELKPEWFEGIDNVGITAGASTPEWIIKEVISKMNELTEKKITDINDKGVEIREQNDNQPVDSPQSDQAKMVEKYEETIKTLKAGDITEGTVVQIRNNEVLVNVGYKSDGIIPINELSNKSFESPEEIVNKGDKIKVVVLKVEDKEGNLILSKKRADLEEAWEYIETIYKNKTTIEAEVLEEVKGGLLVDIKGLRGFIPASHVGLHYVPDLSIYVGKKVKLKVIELDRRKNRIILSQKEVLEEEHEKKKKETWENIEEGQVIKGVVRRLADFGAFVDIGGVDGLVHISEMSWGRINHPSEVLKEGDEIEVKVLGVDRERERISLGLKQVLPDPWEDIDKKYKIGSIITGKVVKLVSFGAFVEIEPGVEGLVHISQISHKHIAKPEDVLEVGQSVNVKVIDIKKDEHKMSLSIKEADKPVIKKEEKETFEIQEGSGVTLGEMFGDLFEETKQKEEE